MTLAEEGFSQYALCRRTISFIHPLLIVGLGVGIPRFVAFSSVDKSMRNPGSYFLSGLFIILFFSTIFLVTIFFTRDIFSYLVFGDKKFSYLIPDLELMLLGIIIHSASYGYFRGKVMMIHANLLQLINLSILPLLVFLFFNTIEDILAVTGLLWIVISLILFFAVLLKDSFKWSEIISCGKELLNYGIQRVPGDVALGGFLALPAYLTAHFVNDNLKTAGYVAFGMSLLNMAGAAFAPICLLLLPKVSKIIAKNDFNLLKRQVNVITVWTISITVLGLLIIEFFAEPLIKIYLGAMYGDLALSVRIIMTASVGYTIYISLRSVLDAYYIRAVNTKNIFIVFIIFLIGVYILWWVGFNYLYMLFIFVFSFSLLGFLTFFETKKIIRSNISTILKTG